jgi:hypothetical protein
MDLDKKIGLKEVYQHYTGNFCAELSKKIRENIIKYNLVSLQDYCTQIQLLLNLINIEDNDVVGQSNLASCKEAIQDALKTDTIELMNIYIRLGNFLSFLIPSIKDNPTNFDHTKKITIHYLDIAKLTESVRLKKIAFAITDALTKEK